MATYQVRQIIESDFPCDAYAPRNRRPGISDDGARVVFGSNAEPTPMVYGIRLYERGSGAEARLLSVEVDGDERTLCARYPQISGNGEKIIFHAPYFYTTERAFGIYVYDIPSGEIRLVVRDMVPDPEHPTAPGWPGQHKYVGSQPSISTDGTRIAYVWTDYEYSAATRDKWWRTRERLMVAEIGDVTVAALAFG